MTEALAAVVDAPQDTTPAPPATPEPCPTCLGSGRANPVMRPCGHCGTAITIGPTARRSNSRYCNDSCRQNGYRARKKTAS